MKAHNEKIFAEINGEYATCRDMTTGKVIRIFISSNRKAKKLEKLWGECREFSEYWKAAIESKVEISFNEY